jgi:hypothetical protein
VVPLPGAFAVVAPVHPAFAAGSYPSERTGVDAKFAALVDRHVLRC